MTGPESISLRAHNPLIVLARLWGKVEIDGNGCWKWNGSINAFGYAVFSVVRKMIFAHRALWILFNGDIPEGLELDHLCRNRACVNPNHLEPVPHQVNVNRGLGGLKSHCKRGHLFSPDNVIHKRNYRGSFDRRCKTCRDLNWQEWYAKNRVRKFWLKSVKETQ